MKLPSPGILGLILFASEVLIGVTRRSQRDAAATDSNSLRLLWIVIMASIILGLRAIRFWPNALLPNRPTWALAGLIIFILGLALRWYSIIHLGRFFTVDVAIAADHQLVETGPYRLVRHPSYTGALLAFLGFALSVGNWAALLVMLLPIFSAFLYRIKVEERALRSALGERYVTYSQRTRRLIPILY